MKNLLPFLLVVLFFASGVYLLSFSGQTSIMKPGEGAMEANYNARLKWFNRMLADPSTGKVPAQVREHELLFSKKLPFEQQLGKNFGHWVKRGPANIGGRTRIVAMDMRNEKILMAGAASGGIWHSHDGGASWYQVDINNENPNITTLIQDQRIGHQDEWYAGTGELYGGTLPGAFNSGNGIYKSEDNGKTWKRHTTFTINPGGISNDWSAIFRIAQNKTVDSAANLFVATFNGIQRSVNGGKTWQRVRGSGLSNYSYFTDVAITPDGVVYAALSSGNGHQGIWRSTDNGVSWTNITPTFYPADCGRIVIGIAPSNPNLVYFTAHTPGTGKTSYNFEGKPERNSLWKYMYVSGNGTGSGGVWTDLSENLPAIGGHFGDFITQQGYCLSIQIHPTNPDIVMLGGTNLYRSTNGFSSSANTTWIGGYAVGTMIPDFKIYQNHHPDHHGVLFYPSNPSFMISFHDGGISRTNDALASSVIWESLNNRYVTTQFYTVAINKSTTDNVLVGGLQDNGTLLTSTDNNLAPWTMPLSYDGAWCYVSPDGSEYYLSIQQGRISRIKLDANQNPLQFARLNPTGVSKEVYQFINPFTPDANNWKKLYLPAGNIIWRNDDVSVKPLKTEFDTTTSLVNWNMLSNTRDSAGGEYTAIYSSPSQADVVYAGTSNGRLIRIRQASDNASVPESIRGANFPSAYINCIAQHPNDSQKLFVVFTNYGVLSVFYSANGGQSWTPVSGNLEENANGTGYGPSCRWLTVVPLADTTIYYLGTSTGLYATTYLNGPQTVWVKQSPDQIGNHIVMMMDYRNTDGLLAVATYGAGMFTAKVKSVVNTTGLTSVKAKSRLLVYPNPANGSEVHFSLPIEADLYDGSGKKVRSIVNANKLDIQNLEKGIYYLKLHTGEVRKILIQY